MNVSQVVESSDSYGPNMLPALEKHHLCTKYDQTIMYPIQQQLDSDHVEGARYSVR